MATNKPRDLVSIGGVDIDAGLIVFYVAPTEYEDNLTGVALSPTYLRRNRNRLRADLQAAWDFEDLGLSTPVDTTGASESNIILPGGTMEAIQYQQLYWQVLAQSDYRNPMDWQHVQIKEDWLTIFQYDAQWLIAHPHTDIPAPHFGFDVVTATFFANLPADAAMQFMPQPGKGVGFFTWKTVSEAWSELVDIIKGPGIVVIIAATAGAASEFAGAGAEAGATAGEAAADTAAADTVAPVVAGAGDSSAAAAAAVGGATAEVNSGASSADAAAAAAAHDTSTDVIGGAQDAIKSAQDAITSVIQPIADAVHSISATVQEINDDLIKPIVDPIKGIIEGYHALVKEIAADRKAGFEGLLRIPSDLSNFVSETDTLLQTSLNKLGIDISQSLGDAYAKVAPHVGAQGFADLRESLTTVHKFHTVLDERQDMVHLSDDLDIEKITEQMRAFLTQLRETTGWWSGLFHMGASLLEVLPMIAGLGKANADAAYDAGKSVVQATRLSPGEALAAETREFLDTESADRELHAAGYSDKRLAVLRRLSQLQPTIAEAIAWHRRGFIDTALRDRFLKEAGAIPEHFDLYNDAAYSSPAFNDVLTELVAARVAEANIGRRSYTEPAPDALRAAALRDGISVEAADAAWRAHWGTLSTPSVINAYWRSLITWQQAEAMLRLGGLPDELHAMYRDILRPRIPQRALSSFVKAGIMSVGDVETEMREEGWREVDISRYMRLLGMVEHPDEPAHVDALHGLSIATVVALYDAHTIKRDKAHELLVRLGAGADAAELQLELHDVQSQMKIREAARKRISAQARSGALTVLEAQAKLAEIGLEADEINDTITAIEHAITAADKQPSEGELSRMLHAGIIDSDTYLAALRREGFSDFWANSLLQLANVPKQASPKVAP